MSRRRGKSKRSGSQSAPPRQGMVAKPPQTSSRVSGFARQWKWPLAALGGLVFASVVVSSAQLKEKPTPLENRPRQSPADAYRSVLAADPSNDQAHYNLGRVLQSQGKREEAIAHYPEILKEIRLTLQECGRRVAMHIRKGRREADELKKRAYIEKYIPQVAVGLEQILGLSERQRGKIVTNLTDVLERSRKL